MGEIGIYQKLLLDTCIRILSAKDGFYRYKQRLTWIYQKARHTMSNVLLFYCCVTIETESRPREGGYSLRLGRVTITHRSITHCVALYLYRADLFICILIVMNNDVIELQIFSQ